jgi:hypothetical protein
MPRLDNAVNVSMDAERWKRVDELPRRRCKCQPSGRRNSCGVPSLRRERIRRRTTSLGF